MRYSKKARKYIALTLFFVLASQLILPNMAMALTTGPSQPEVQSFEPVGTTDMVDMFSGSFVYNIPLMDVEGYPVNISYHGGVNMEQEASWVGLGWNINPGEINRTVRGIPDDFNGDVISKELHIKDDITVRLGVGVGLEAFGAGDPFLSLSASLGANLSYNNYRGMSCDFDLGSDVNLFRSASLGVNIGVGSATGAEIDYNENITFPTASLISNDMAGGIGVGVTQGVSSRTGLKETALTYTANVGTTALSTTNHIPVGIKNYVPVITNSSSMISLYGRIKVGLEGMWLFGWARGSAMVSVLSYNDDGSRPSYGYLYLQNAEDSTPGHVSIMDFTRDKDGQFNQTMQYLPPANMTYDIYSVCGQGTGGVFRAFRNDFGSVYDPVTSSSQHTYSGGVEGGPGWIFEIGGDFTKSKTDLNSGPCTAYLRDFTSTSIGSVYENTYLKQGGELTLVDPQYFTDIGGTDPIDPATLTSLPKTKANSSTQRDARGNLVYYFTAREDQAPGVGTNPNIISYNTNGFSGGPDAATTTIGRIGSGPLDHKPNEISEIVQLQKDGRKYVYGLPALNHIQKEATFSVDHGRANIHDGTVAYTPGTEDSRSNTQGTDHYYSSTTTPAYVHSYLLTSVLSSDYMDVTGDGPTDDDLGSYTKLNYSLKSADYRWKAPYENGLAQYSPGYWSDPKDDKGSYVMGSRDEWMLHSIVTKNFVAEFYTSPRSDAQGCTEAIKNTGSYDMAPYNASTSAAPSYKLDSIKLYNKHDRFINKGNAVPIKTVFFVYDYSLCNGIPNGSGGKLTLKKIYFRYGNSQRSMLSPYQFSYSTFNPNYKLSCKDRWGDYKPDTSALTNYEFPFVNQNDTAKNSYASAWSLTGISLPSGGMIQSSYESNDYAYVQDKPANEMFIIQGIGNGPGFNPSTQLYSDENSPHLYVYFKRRTGSELPGVSFRDNYLHNDSVVYYNFSVNLSKGYEQIKGYTNIVDMDICPDNHNYGYIQLESVVPTGGHAVLNPVTYTAINTARYNYPGAIFPGSGPGPDGDLGMIAGLEVAFKELISIYKNPLIRLVKKDHDACAVNLSKSFIRLQSPGLCKKGGGQRVKSLYFYDSWNALAGGNESTATYGKNYKYTTTDDYYGTVSSGVASYEPMIGGDENPFRRPVPYIVESGGNWPPNDPIDLYQETPIGESLFPPAAVGYSKITVTSIHSAVGRSSQGMDVYQFYTAKDFPAQVNASAINSSGTHHFDFFTEEDDLAATQGYSLIFNDMHGKPKSVEHYVSPPRYGLPQMINYQVYNYHMSGGLLDNNVNCLVYDPHTRSMIVKNQQLGIEEDVTIDTRQKDEQTSNYTYNGNLNVSGILFFIFPIPTFFPYPGAYHKNFTSATVTKVVQQYGILDNVQSFNEGAVTTQRNELFDSKTGQVVVTSVNNEYHDKEFTVNIPAYWGYVGMSPAYGNIKYQAIIPKINIDSFGLGMFSSAANFNVGDEFLMEYDFFGSHYQENAWFMGSGRLSGNTIGCPSCCHGFILPRFPAATPGWGPLDSLMNVKVTVINSGAKNLLNETIETYTMLDNPVDGWGHLKVALDSVISIKAKTFCDSNTRILNYYIANPGLINPYVMGERGIYRPLTEYAYITNRNYAGTTSRNAGLFDPASLYNLSGYDSLNCIQFPYNYFAPYGDPNWQVARTVTKWSPYGKEVENRDAVGNYSSAVYGYNQQLPIAVASNALQGEVLADGFEDYSLLNYINNKLGFGYSPFYGLFGTTPLSPPSATYNILNLTTSGLSIVATSAHTGNYALSVPTASGGISGVYQMGLPINFNNYSGDVNHYNSYYPKVKGLPFNFSSANEYLPFELSRGKKYVLSFWVKQSTTAVNITSYPISDSCGIRIDATFYPLVKKSNIIDGWQQVEATFTVSPTAGSAVLRLPAASYFVDDIRLFPSDANMKSFVYNPVNEKLMATLDENNFATMYEYDQEGNLVRTKKETEKGIMTVSESRSNNPKQ